MRSKKGTNPNNAAKINQDIFLSCLNCGSRGDVHAFVVGDGHGPSGQYVSGFLKEKFRTNFTNTLQNERK
jgi:serine/threonine protein phosphatase PrpC